jgi:hypothetical protein
MDWQVPTRVSLSPLFRHSRVIGFTNCFEAPIMALTGPN